MFDIFKKKKPAPPKTGKEKAKQDMMESLRKARAEIGEENIKKMRQMIEKEMHKK